VWKFIDNSDVETILETFFRSPPEYKFNGVETCAIVGNSGKILDRNKGDEINNHDCIVRFNAAPTDGFESHVGSKTDFRVLNGPIMIGGSVDYVTTPRNWISGLKKERLILMPHRRKRKEEHFKTARELAGEFNEIYITKNDIESHSESATKEFGITKPSTGLKTILLFLSLFGSVNLYGFGFHRENDLKKRHYWEDFKYHGTGGHRWGKEKRFAKRLVNEYNATLK